MTDISQLPLFDTHQHLIYRGHFDYSWTAAVPPLAKGDFTIVDYLSSANGEAIDMSLFMETGVDDAFWQDETRFSLALADNPSSNVVGVIASCRPEGGEKKFDAWLDELKNTRVVGFRRILHVEPDGLSTTDVFINNVRKLGDLNLTFDMCFLERQLPAAIKLAQNCDNTRLILNHCGIPDIAAGNFEHWKNHITTLAKLPNVFCKVSGVIAYCPAEKITIETIRPYIEHCIEAFGFDRIIWGSDWPVCNLTSDIKSWASIFRSLVASESHDVQRKLFMGNAIDIYNIPALNNSVPFSAVANQRI